MSDNPEPTEEEFSEKVTGQNAPENDVLANEFEVATESSLSEDGRRIGTQPEIKEQALIIEDESEKVVAPLETEEPFVSQNFDFLDAASDTQKDAFVEEISGMIPVSEDLEDDEFRDAESQISKSVSTRRSTISHRKSISISRDHNYEDSQKPSDRRRSTLKAEARLTDIGLEPQIAKSDILSSEEDYFMGFEMETEAPVVFDEVYVEDEASIEEEIREPLFVLDRIPYYERHDRVAEFLEERKIRNFILQKKLAIYFKHKKMDYVTKETDWSLDLQNKYNRKLEAYGELIEFDANERLKISKEIEVTKEKRDKKFNELTAMFKKMQDREAAIGYGLINTKTGNVIPDKHVERLINRQNLKIGQVSSMRLTFITLKQMVQEKLDKIADLDEIAPGFRLADFEHLKVMNQNYADKLEEKDEALTRVRAKCTNTTQILAHLREKSYALSSDLSDLLYEYGENRHFCHFARTRLNRLKQRRDSYRSSTSKLKDECGLLTQPKLLRDMQHGLTQIEGLTTKLEQLKKEHKVRTKQIKIIRQKIEQGVELHRNTKKSSLKNSFGENTKKKPVIYKGRPTLTLPEIDSKAFLKVLTR